MQIREKMPWKREGARHAHVEVQVPVPRVMPAAINAPTLKYISVRDSAYQCLSDLLVEIIE